LVLEIIKQKKHDYGLSLSERKYIYFTGHQLREILTGNDESPFFVMWLFHFCKFWQTYCFISITKQQTNITCLKRMDLFGCSLYHYFKIYNL